MNDITSNAYTIYPSSNSVGVVKNYPIAVLLCIRASKREDLQHVEQKDHFNVVRIKRFA